MIKSKSIEKELDELVNIHEHGGGFGAPEAKEEHERKIDLLKHKQILAVNKSNSRMGIFNVLIALINVGVLIYQVFFR